MAYHLEGGGVSQWLGNLARAADSNDLNFDAIRHGDAGSNYQAELQKLGVNVFTLPSPRSPIKHAIARPAVSAKRLSLLSNGSVRYELKTPYRDCTTRVIFEPMDFIARLVALVPKPRLNLTRFDGVFAPNSAHRGQVTLAKRGKGNPRPARQMRLTSAGLWSAGPP